MTAEKSRNCHFIALILKHPTFPLAAADVRKHAKLQQNESVRNVYNRSFKMTLRPGQCNCAAVNTDVVRPRRILKVARGGLGKS